jgi:hypothetical protein
VINVWVGDEDGLNRASLLKYGKLTRNDMGKWGIRHEGDHSLYNPNERSSRTVYDGDWEEFADEIVYY